MKLIKIKYGHGFKYMPNAAGDICWLAEPTRVQHAINTYTNCDNTK
jgi:hypothetical protein